MWSQSARQTKPKLIPSTLLDSSEKTIAILGDRWCPRKAKQGGDKVKQNIFMYAIYG